MSGPSGETNSNVDRIAQRGRERFNVAEPTFRDSLNCGGSSSRSFQWRRVRKSSFLSAPLSLFPEQGLGKLCGDAGRDNVPRGGSREGHWKPEPVVEDDDGVKNAVT